ncbi:MAG: serine--tRNA ligase [Planctomycetota bacterium]
MIDLKQLRDDPDRFRDGARKKRVDVDIDRILALDTERRSLQQQQETLRAEQKSIEKQIGPQLGKLMGQLKKAEGNEKARLETEAAEIRNKPAALKGQIQALDERIGTVAPELETLLLQVPLPPDPDVPIGETGDDNVQLGTWAPEGFDLSASFAENKGFEPKTHLELIESLGLCDFERGVKVAGARSYVLTGDGMRLHQAILRYAFDFIRNHGFRPTSVPVLVREEAMTGTGFFPGGRDQSYHINEAARGSGYDLFLTGTGEVGLMGLHQGEILDEAKLPLKYATVSTCFRREAGAAGKDTAGLYRIHQFDKVEQVIICKADEAESRAHHRAMIEIVESLLKSLGLPHRQLQCCTGDLGAKNADMIDLECWMPGRGPLDNNNRPTGAFGETHSASRLYDFQCRRLNMRYRQGGEGGKGPTTFCHSLNNTVAASPRILIPLMEIHQQADGSINIPEPLRPHMGGAETIG